MSFIVVIQDPPTVTIKSSSDTIKEGDDVTLECQASGGNPQRVDSYQWSRRLDYKKDDSTALPIERTWSFMNVSYTDAGIYICTVMNAASSGQEIALLNIHCKYVKCIIFYFKVAVYFCHYPPERTSQRVSNC